MTNLPRIPPTVPTEYETKALVPPALAAFTFTDLTAALRRMALPSPPQGNCGERAGASSKRKREKRK